MNNKIFTYFTRYNEIKSDNKGFDFFSRGMMKKLREMSNMFMSFLVAFALVSIGCSDDNGSETVIPFGKKAVVVTAAADYSSGAHSVITLEKPRSATNNLLPTGSDLTVAAFGDYFYRIERYQADNITKFHIDAPSDVIWQYSTLEGSVSTNVYDMVFVNDDKAYLICYCSVKVWIVNPSANSEAEFKIGELDLSLYADSDDIPEISSGILVDGKLYITVQRLDRDNYWTTSNTSYVAVFDTATDQEIDTGITNSDGVKGIPLTIRNQSSIDYIDGALYISATGNWSDSYYGIQKVNLSTYEPDVDLIYDEKIVIDIALVSSTKGYFIDYVGWENTALRSFNPSTGVVSDGNIAGIGDSGDRNLSGLSVDSSGMLWVSDASLTNPGIYIIDTSNDQIDEGPISTNLNPGTVVFCGYFE